MDFVRLGPAYSSEYVPDLLIEGFNSLVWTERFLTHGEFELKSFAVSTLVNQLPEDTLVSHLGTREVMIVETHEFNTIENGDGEQEEITVKGRSLDSFLYHRWVESKYGKKRRMRRQYPAKGAAAVLLWNSLDNVSGKDVTRGDPEAEDQADNDFSWNTLDVVPNIAITDSVTFTGTNRWWKLQEGSLYPQLQKILLDADLGLRTLRPVPGLSPGEVIRVKTALMEDGKPVRGEIVREQKEDIKALQFNLYDGIDRSDSIFLNQIQGHLEKTSRVKSNQTFKTICEIMTSVGGKDVARVGDAGFTGFRRRTMGYDAGDPELPPEPVKPKEPRANASQAQRQQYREDLDRWRDKHDAWENKVNRIVSDFKDENEQEAKRELKKNRRINVFSADVTPLAPHVYKRDYFLGDTITLVDRYGNKVPMIVSEYTQTQDANGERGFPGLVAP